MDTDLLNDFNYLEYKYLNKDINLNNEYECKEHYRKYGKYENRIYKLDVPDDFNYLEYKYLNKDLGTSNEFECKEHYVKYGKQENRLYKLDVPANFNYLEYKFLNKDLGNITEYQCKEHYIKHGKKENRLYRFDAPYDFNYLEYKYLNKDLSEINELELKYHYSEYGRLENRLYKFNIPNDFDYKNYKFLNEDIKFTNELELKEHYEKYGIYENRYYKFSLPYDFNYITYKYINKDIDSIPIVNDINFKKHYLNYGINDMKNYSEYYLIKLYALYYHNDNLLNLDFSMIDEIKLNNFKTLLDRMNKVSMNELEKYILLENYYELNIINKNNSYFSENLIYVENNLENRTYNKFNNIYNIITSNKKEHFRYICYRYLNYIRNIKININYDLNNHNETVFIEFRILHHIEFNIRNMCSKLPNWKHTIICGIENYDYIKKICYEISDKINIIKLDINNITKDEYSKLLTSNYFWNLLTGIHILIHKEDSLIFNSSTIDNWLKYDYVGTPWEKNTYEINYLVGNGNFSLRKKETMIYICNNYDINNYEIFDITKKYMEDNNFSITPEDCFFVKCIIDNNLGIIPSYDKAAFFSYGNINCEKSLGGYKFWINDNNWIKRFDTIVKQYYSSGLQYLKVYNYRYGWNNLLMTLYTNDIITIFNKNNNIELIDMCENYFASQNNKTYKKWVGIVHLSINSQNSLEYFNINNLFKNINFNKSIKNCLKLISLSKYVESQLIENIKIYDNNSIEIKNIYHPIKDNRNNYNKIIFNYKKYLNNKNKCILQIGSQMRILKTFLYLKLKKFKKIWLSININDTLNFLKKELYLTDNATIDLNNFNIEHKYVSNYEYDDLLSQNIIFIHLFDSSANNTILEAITNKVPIIVNKHPSIIEYLGEDYPLYFNNEHDIDDNFISNENILNAYNYLNKYKFNDLSYKKFSEQLLEALDNYQ